MNNLKSSFPSELAKAPKKSKTWVFKRGSRQAGVLTVAKGVQNEVDKQKKAQGMVHNLREKIERDKRLKAVVKIKVMEGYARLPLKNDGINYFVQPRNANGSFAKKVILGQV